MRKRKMPTITVDNLSLGLQMSKQHRAEEEIQGLIKVYRDGRVERPQIIPNVSCSLPPEFFVTSTDVKIDKSTNIWARCYIPRCDNNNKVPLLVYFHGGGFCVGSASWSCYHEFLAKLARKANCAVLSVNYRLAPENPLPAAYDDGVNTIMWLRQHAATKEYYWANKCDFSSIFLSGDSAGANIAYNVAIRLCPRISDHEFKSLYPLDIKGTILIQPFFGGELRTYSEIYTVQPSHSALTLATSDTYWRLALPVGANRDHPWCNPTVNMKELRVPPSLVLISELDILKDRNLELCGALSRGGKKVEFFMCKGVGHAFHILSKSQFAQSRTDELIAQIKAFITRSYLANNNIPRCHS